MLSERIQKMADDLGEFVEVSVYNYEKFLEDDEMLASEIDKMEELNEQQLYSIEIRPQDKGKKFVAYPDDIKESEETGIEYSYAIK